MPAEFENGRITNSAVLLTETKFCRQNLEILPASCKREAKTALFHAVFKFYRHRLNGVKVAPVLLWHFTSAVFVQRQFFNINPDMVSISRSLTPVLPLNTEPILAVPLFFSNPTDHCDHLRLFQVDDSKKKQNKTSTLLIHEDSINYGE